MLKNRQSLRLKGFDYGSNGAYFITICTHQHQNLFGTIINDGVQLNPIGEIVRDEWLKTSLLRPNVQLDDFIVMPDHFHAIIVIIERRGVLQYAPTNKICSPSQTIGAIVRGFKSASTKRINIFRQTPNQPLWQRSFYDHIIRNEKSLHEIRKYIRNNHLRHQYGH